MHKDKMKIIYEQGQMDVTTILKKCNGDTNEAHITIEKAVSRFIDSEIRISINTLQELSKTLHAIASNLETLREAKRFDIKYQLEIDEVRTWLSINQVKEWQRFISHQEALPANQNAFDTTTDVPF